MRTEVEQHEKKAMTPRIIRTESVVSPFNIFHIKRTVFLDPLQNNFRGLIRSGR
jgi:hypothetical protein